jgi:hypothetical protein
MFEPGRVYRRDEVHRQWNGSTQLQREGGILTPREVPLVIVITTTDFVRAFERTREAQIA